MLWERNSSSGTKTSRSSLSPNFNQSSHYVFSQHVGDTAISLSLTWLVAAEPCRMQEPESQNHAAHVRRLSNVDRGNSSLSWRRQRRTPILLWLGAVFAGVLLCTSARLALYASDLTAWPLMETPDVQLKRFLRDGALRRVRSHSLDATSDEGIIRTQHGDLQGTLSLQHKQSSRDVHSFHSPPNVSAIPGEAVPSRPSNPTEGIGIIRPETAPPVITQAKALSLQPMLSGQHGNSSSIALVPHLSYGSYHEAAPQQRVAARNSSVPSAPTFSDIGIDIRSRVGSLATAAALLPIPGTATSRTAGSAVSLVWTSLVTPKPKPIGVPSSNASSPSFNFQDFRSAFKYGTLGGQVENGNLLRHRQASLPWLASLHEHVGLNHSTVVWLGCFHGPEPPLAPLLTAAEYPHASVVLLHVCHGTANLSALSAARDSLEVTNAILLSYSDLSKVPLDCDDDIAEAWNVVRSRELFVVLQGCCEVLVITPGAVSAMLTSMLPHEAESALATVLQWCLKSVFIQGKSGWVWPYKHYWAGLQSFIEAALARVQHPDLVSLTRSDSRVERGLTARETASFVVVRANHSHAGSERASSISLSSLVHVLSITIPEVVRILLNAFSRGSFLGCVVSGDRADMMFNGGNLCGCSVSPIAARRSRFHFLTSEHQGNPYRRDYLSAPVMSQ